MKRSRFLLLCAGLALIGLAGCGRIQQEREPWRRQAELACLRSKQINPGDYIKKSPPIGTGWSCGADFPLKVSAFAEDVTGSIPGETQGKLMTGITPVATLVCPMVVAMDNWIANVIQPAAMARFGQPVTRIKTMGSYNCRPRNNQAGAKLSEHGFANAVDIAGFELADGQTISIVRDWTRGTPQAQAFLRQVHLGACQYFTTVLGPGANIFHYNHIHVDLARHGARGNYHYCRPLLKAADILPPPSLFDPVPRPGPETLNQAYLGRPGANPAAPVYNQPAQAYGQNSTPRPAPYGQQPGGYAQAPASVAPAYGGGQAAPVYGQLGPAGQGYNPQYRPPVPVGAPMAVGARVVEPPVAGQPAPPDDPFLGNDDENVNVHDLDLPDDGTQVTGALR